MRVPTPLQRGPFARRRVTPAEFDAATTYRLMVRMRLVDEALTQAWADGLVPGEYHSGIGEEGINAGILAHLSEQDTVHLDHRNTPGFIARGTDPEALMLEVLGTDQGMNGGMAGHMHLMDPDVGAGCDGMVGAGGPLAVGAAVSHAMRNPGAVAVTFHGEATMNQGMLMEAYNMAVAWNLPVVFVCKDNKWSITTYSSDVTGGTPLERAKGFGLHVETANGDRVEDVFAAAGKLVERARAGKGPGFLYVTCHRPGGHFEGDGLVRLLRTPRVMAAAWGPGLATGASHAEGGKVSQKAGGVGEITKRGARAARDWVAGSLMDPISNARPLLDAATVERIESEERAAIEPAIAHARAAVAGRPVFGTPKGGTK
jgi:TPP-dependent pyruvate/acetoin dehydrogenase alpha subunit